MYVVREILACERQVTPKWGVAWLRKAVLEFWDPIPISGMGEARNLKFGVWMEYVSHWHFNKELPSKGA